MKRQRYGELGQGLVEFAVIFPVFMMLVFLVFDGGILMGRYGEVNQAAREGARLAAAGANEGDVRTWVAKQSSGLLDASTSCNESAAESICVYYEKGPADGPIGRTADPGELGSTVKVTVRYRYGLITPLANGGFLGLNLTGLPNGFQVSACAASRLERPVSPGSGTGDNAC